MSIIELSEAQARAHNSAGIRTIKLRLGEFTAVVREALKFSFEVARQGTLAENASLEIETVPLVTRCPGCGPVSSPERDICLRCPRCAEPLEIVSGREMQVEYIDLE